MRVVLLSETFAYGMGYLNNLLPKWISRLGVDIHVITEDLAPNYRLSDFQGTYGSFISDALRPGMVDRIDGYTLHVVAHKCSLGYMRMQGLSEKLHELRPDVVQTVAAIGWIPLDAAILKQRFGYKLFTGSSTTASVFPLAHRTARLWDSERIKCFWLRGTHGRFISLRTQLCYAATTDCADVANRFFGVQRSKTVICPLGVDTEMFRPMSCDSDVEARRKLRSQFGWSDSDIVCIYTGRFTADKNPLLLATAIANLRGAGHPFHGLFIGSGAQMQAIESHDGVTVHPFVPTANLARYFQAADIGVWPTQESMSMLDAAACGLPIVVNDTLKATERIAGNGLTYRLNDSDDLARRLLELSDPETRKRLGSSGASRMARECSWDAAARRRVADYAAAVENRLLV